MKRFSTRLIRNISAAESLRPTQSLPGVSPAPGSAAAQSPVRSPLRGYSRKTTRAVMSGFAVACALLIVLISVQAFAFDEMSILKVEKPVNADQLWQMGLLYLADLGNFYLVWGNDAAAGRLAKAGGQFELVATVRSDKVIFLVSAGRSKVEKPVSKAPCGDLSEGLCEVVPGHYLVAILPEDIDDASLAAFPRVKLQPGRFPAAEPARFVVAPMAATPKPEIESLVASVSGDSLWTYISQLSGREPVTIGGVLDTLLTRYSFNWRIEHAANYLRERFEAYGYDVAYHDFVMGKYDFYGVDFVSARCGWVVNSGVRVYRTIDGGLTWVRQNPGAFNQFLSDVCFVDSLQGWVVGTAGTIYHTANGGQTWARQTAPANFAWIYAVDFVDAQNGWIAGQGGRIARTTNGGTTWTAVASGTSADINGIDFEALDRGWAVGNAGTILAWDGTSWSGETSGTAENLFAVDFATSQVGWVVGGGRTVLKTTDGGTSWVPQTLPSEASPYLQDVRFPDTSNGWAVGVAGTVAHTADGGSTWQMQSTGSGVWIGSVDFVSPQEGWVAGATSLVCHTENGGDAWQDQRGNFPTGTVTQLRNVVATKPGTVSTDEVIICGHYDDYSSAPNNPTPGADDNASGTAGVLEAARVLASHPSQRTIKFLCVAAEEQGCYGSAAYAYQAKTAGDNVLGVFNFDMIGYVDVAPESVNCVCDDESEWLVDFAQDCAAAYVPSLGTVKQIDSSQTYSGDHVSFWLVGYSAMETTEDDPLTNPYWHTTADTLGTMTQAFATDVTRMVVAAAAELAVPDLASGVPPAGTRTSIVATPNPFRSETAVSFRGLTGGIVRAGIYDVQGRLLRRLVRDQSGSATRDLVWDGMDDSGHRVAPGIYFAGVSWAEGSVFTKIVMLR